jgi:hypothetical protein
MTFVSRCVASSLIQVQRKQRFLNEIAARQTNACSIVGGIRYKSTEPAASSIPAIPTGQQLRLVAMRAAIPVRHKIAVFFLIFFLIVHRWMSLLLPFVHPIDGWFWNNG